MIYKILIIKYLYKRKITEKLVQYLKFELNQNQQSIINSFTKKLFYKSMKIKLLNFYQLTIYIQYIIV